MNLDDFAQQIQDMESRLVQMQQRTRESPSQPQHSEIIAIAFQELSTALEELRVTHEERQQQDQELLATRQAVEAERQRYQELFEFAPDAYLVTDPNGVIQAANRAAATLLNISPQFLVNKPLAIYVIEEDRSAFRTELNQLCQVNEVQEWELGLQPRNQKSVTVAVMVAADQNQEGSSVCFRWLLRDITKRRQAEDALQKLNQELEHRVRERTAELEQLNEQLQVEIAQRTAAEVALRRREQEFKALVENAPDMIFRLDCQLRYLYMNPAIEQATGIPRAEFIGKTNHELDLQKSHVSLWDLATERVFKTGAAEMLEFSLLTPTGLRYYQSRLVPEFSADGSVESVLGVSRDITPRKQSEDALRESEERFRQLAENIDEVFWITSPDASQLLYVSPAYEQIWGRSCALLYEQPQSWINAVHPEDQERLRVVLEKPHPEDYDTEYRIIRPDGSIRWIRDRAFPVQDATGQVCRVVGIAEDITRLKQGTVDSYNALQKEQELSKLKSRFVALTSHEFRTPLTTIQSSAGLLQRYRDRWSEEKQLTYFYRIQTAVECMTQMLNEMLLISEGEAGKLEFNPTPITLFSFCQELVEELQQGIGQQYTITLTNPCKCVSANIDTKLLRHILSNLLSNAIKYSPTDSIIRFDLSCLEGNAVFQIQDQGIGIPPEDQPRLFESFHRATNVGSIPGTGLGLVIVKQCVDLHNGTITVASEVNQGTTFTVTLPLNN